MADLFDVGYLDNKVIGHGRPVGLVFGVEFMPEGGTLGIKDHGQVIRALLVRRSFESFG